MADARTRRLAERIAKIVAEMLERRIKDPQAGLRHGDRGAADRRPAGGDGLLHGLGHAGGAGGDAPPRCTARPASSAPRWAGSIGLRHTPSIEFVADALPDSARRIDDLVAAARQADEELARAREGATWAGDPDPYKKPAEDEDDWADEDE